MFLGAEAEEAVVKWDNDREKPITEDTKGSVKKPSTGTVPDASNEALGAARAAIVRKLAEIGLQNPNPASYLFHLGSHGNSPEFPDKGTVVGGLVDNKIEVWIENRLLRRW